MDVGDLDLRTIPGWTELSADLGGERVHIRVPPDVPMEAWGGAFLVLALPEAMGRGEPLRLDASIPVSPTLLKHACDVQEIYHCWNAELRRVPIECATVAPPPPPRPGASALYSGGVDSAYTFLRHRDEISHLVFIEGFDHVDTPEAVAERSAHRARFAGRFGKGFVHVASNYREVARARKLEWFLVHGNCLAAICLALGFERAYIPSSHSYAQLFPWGSHPLVDPLWSNGRTEVVHDGSGAGRTEKIRALGKSQEMLDDVVVCWRYSDRNCGTCPKCVRTMITLHLLGLKSSAFPPFRSPRQLRGLTVRDRNELAFLDENIALAREVGDRDMERRLLGYQRRFAAQSLVEEIDRLLLGRALRSLYRKIWKPEWLEASVSLGPKR